MDPGRRNRGSRSRQKCARRGEISAERPQRVARQATTNRRPTNSGGQTTNGARGRLRIVTAILFVAAAGCRIPGYGGPRSQTVLQSRQFSQQGAGALERQDWAAAESLFSQAVAACPSDVDARRQYAETLWHRGAVDQAIEQLLAASKVAPEDPTLLDRLAEFRLTDGNLEDARRDAETAIDLDPRSADAWMVRGKVMRQLGDNRQALADLHKALSYDPRNAHVLHELAQTYLVAGQPQRALSNLQSLLDLHSPGDEPSQLLDELGQAYAGLGRYDEAVDNYHNALARDRTNPDILYHLSEAEIARGNAAVARVVLEQAIARDPANPRYQHLMARLPARGNVQSR